MFRLSQIGAKSPNISQNTVRTANFYQTQKIGSNSCFNNFKLGSNGFVRFYSTSPKTSHSSELYQLVQGFKQLIGTNFTKFRSVLKISDNNKGAWKEFYEKQIQKKGKSTKKKNSIPPIPQPGRGLRDPVTILALSSTVVFGAVFLASTLAQASSAESLSFQQFYNKYLVTSKVTKIEIYADHAVVLGSSGALCRILFSSPVEFEKQLLEAQEDMGSDPFECVPIEFKVDVALKNILLEGLTLVPLIASLGILYMFLKRSGGSILGGAGGFTNSKAKLWEGAGNKNVKFTDVAGCDEAKYEIMEFVHFLKKPEKYEKLGARIPKGALLVGPPGTGKTLLAKAVAGESGVPFYSMSGADFMELFVGVGPARVRDLFKTAKSHKGPSIIFIDELDAIGGKREARMGGSDERENTLNQLLVEMDGMDTSSQVVVFAGTNRPEVLDPALVRPGRFDKKVVVDLPDVKGRHDILKIYLANITLEPGQAEIFAKKFSTLTVGFSGADLSSVCNEAALHAARAKREFVIDQDFEDAIERVHMGIEKKNSVLTPKEREIVSYHEAGHAVTGWLLEHAYPVLKVSIVPRGKALGYAKLQPRDDNIYTRNQLLDMMCVTLGGRIAEEIIFNKITTGAIDDLQKVKQLATAMVKEYGMSDVGVLSYPQQDKQSFMPELEKPYSQKTARLFDSEIRRMVNEAHERTTKLLKDNLVGVTAVAKLLLEKEHLSNIDMEDILGKRPWSSQQTTFEELTNNTVPS